MKDWTTEINKTTEAFLSAFGSLTTEQLNWKPDAKTWSIAQNIEHLIIINQTYFAILSKLKSGNYNLPFIARFNFMVTLLGKLILNSVNPDRKKKIKTFSIWEPSQSHINSDILEEFVRHQNELKHHIENSADLIKKETVISSPANKNIVYKLKTAFDIIVTHEQRHLEQAKEVLQLIQK